MKKFSIFLSMALVAMTQQSFAVQPTIPLVIPQITTAPTIDGDANDAVWATLPAHPIDVNFRTESFDNAADLTATFKIGHDADFVYVLCQVEDDVIGYDNGGKWNGDNVEVYFFAPGAADLNLGHAAESYRQVAGLATYDAMPFDAIGSNNWGGDASSEATYGVFKGYAETATGYVLEFKISKSIVLSYGIANNTEFPFDICVNDNDAGIGSLGAPSNRNRKFFYNDGSTDEPWQNAAGVGTAILQGAAAGVNAIKAAVNYKISKNVLTVDAANNACINVLDVTGKSVMTVKNTNSVNISNLKAGVYIAKVRSSAGNEIGNLRFIK